jgi:hypothetical protein
MGLPRPPGSPITLAGDGLLACVSAGHGIASALVRGGCKNASLWPLTLASDLGKRRSAQRLALDT